MRIARQLYDQMVDHAQADAPNECCGVIGTRDDQAVVIYPATNIHASPLRYEIDGPELLRIYNDTEDKGVDIGLIYHSHTRSDPYPSQTDVNLAKGYPDALYVIVGLAGEQPEVRAYEIRDGQVTEAQLQVE
jgi:[CysO sulfur-carrier protein]-S-L-cysteine hydrolase